MPINIKDAFQKLIDHSLPFIEKAEIKLKTISDLDVKVKYLEEMKLDYLNNDVYFNAEIREASGVTTNGKNKSEGFDLWCERHIDRIKQEIDRGKEVRKELLSFNWNIVRENELIDLYDLLIKKYKLIANDTIQSQVIDIFTGKQLNDDFKPIEWTAPKNLNVYFLSELLDKKKLHQQIEVTPWLKAKYCFKDGTNFSQIKQQYENTKTGLPRGHEIIDNLLKDLDNLV